MWWSLAPALFGPAAHADPGSAARSAPIVREAVDVGELDAVIRTLSSHDPVSCDVVEAATRTPVQTLLAVVDTVSMPPWAPMRAAGCLVERHAVEVRGELEGWVIAPDKQGLGRLVLASLDAMPVEVAVPVARLALAQGADPALAQRKVGAARSAELRALVTP
ncbi:MAG: hypothetical protein ABMB14_02320 [Myxococcota bacterium]